MTVHNTSFLVLGIVSLILQGIGAALMGVFEGGHFHRAPAGYDGGVVLVVLAPVLMAIGGSFYCAGKNRSAFWGLLGLLSPLGLLILAVLEDRSAKPDPS